MNTVVKIENGSLDVSTVGIGDESKDWLVFRGVISPETLTNIVVPEYQRDVLIGKNQRLLIQALRKGVIPDIVLGMRGEKYETDNVDGHPVYQLASRIYVIDGLQRLSAAKRCMEIDPCFRPRLGAMVYVDTDEAWECKMFEDLNQNRVRVSPNVLIYNARTYNPFIDTVYNLFETGNFIFKGMVHWSQIMKRGQLITALNIFRVTGIIHSKFGTGGKTSGIRDIVSPESTMARLMETVGRNIVRENLTTFFNLIHQSYNIETVSFSGKCPFVKGTFLCALAGLLAEHDCFWDGKRLVIDKQTRRKIQTFPVMDPNVALLAGGNHTAESLLRGMLLEHINSGRRKNRIGGGIIPDVQTDDVGEESNGN